MRGMGYHPPFFMHIKEWNADMTAYEAYVFADV